MVSYVLRRILLMIPTMIGITLLLFVVMRLAPGDPATLAVGTVGMGAEGAAMQAESNMEDAITKFRKKYKLDEPLLVQYGYWIGSVARLDFGNEFFRPNVKVRDELWRRMQVTVPLSLVSVILSYLIALPIGILTAVKRGSVADKTATLSVFLLYSLPNFWAGLMLILIFGKTGLGWLPVLGLHDKDAASFTTFRYVMDVVHHAILPVAVLTYGGLAYLSRQMRGGMLEVIRQDYIRTARAKGLSERVVVYKHALRNSLIPVVTLFAGILPILIGGSVIVETIFTIPGMGLYAFEGLVQRDYNVVMGTVTASAFMTLVGFLISDVTYALVDPRIAYD
ncbi:MAG: peptide ABC transporter permease [Gemmatimonadota bacterium]|nr:MAG: peptide ABC transporter permease [Gemmatimonadota bacterium]